MSDQNEPESPQNSTEDDPLEALEEAIKLLGDMDKKQFAQLLDEIEVALKRFMVFQFDAQAIATTLFVCNTWVAQRQPFRYTPYLHVHSPTPETGKSTLFDVMEQLVQMPFSVVDPSSAALYRTIEALQPTVFIDEYDTHNSPKSLTALLNAGFQKGKKIPRASGKHPVFYHVYSPKVIGGIGHLPPVIASRSIPIFLLTAKPSEMSKIERFRVEDAAPILEPLRQRLSDWADEVPIEQAKRPPVPKELGSRTQDIWEPLLVIADLAGTKWGRRARQAAIEIHSYTTDQLESILLLAHIKEAFEKDTRLGTEELLDRLRAIDSDWEKLNGKKLALMLSSFRVRPSTKRLPGGKIRKGYEMRQFTDLWERYVRN